jgi:hypothetical protein
MTDRQTIEAFGRVDGAWLMGLDDGWWAYRNDELPLGPFATKAEAARAGLEAWVPE